MNKVSKKRQKELALHAEIHKLSKRANQRLREMEKQGLTKSSAAYSAVSTFAWDDREFMTTTRFGEFKFKTAVKGRTAQQLNKELKELKKFLNARSSTVRGLKSIYAKSYNAFMDKWWKETKYGEKPDFSVWSEFWKNENIRLISKMFGSEQIVKLIELHELGTLSLGEINIVIDGLKKMMEETHTQFSLDEFITESGNVATEEWSDAQKLEMTEMIENEIERLRQSGVSEITPDMIAEIKQRVELDYEQIVRDRIEEKFDF